MARFIGMRSDRSGSGVRLLLVFVVAVSALYFARDVFVPLALAILLSFALAPLVLVLRRLQVGRIPSVVAAVLLAFTIIFSIGALFASQVTQLAADLPDYEANLVQKIQSVRSITAERGLFSRASTVLRALGSEIDKTTAGADKARATAVLRTASGASRQPVLVEIRQPAATPLEIVQNVLRPLFSPLATTGIVVVFVVLFLLRREDLRDRFIRLAGAGDIRRTTEALNDAARRLSRYLLTQTAINGMFGVIIGTGLWLIGIPNPLLWGVIAMLLRFVPYLGPPIAAVLPLALAVAVDPGWSMLLWTGLLFVTVEPIIGQVIEPLLYGTSTGMSSVAVVTAAVFWTWLWGPIGLLLSTPLTLCLVVLGRHVAHLEFLDIVLGDRPALTLQENFYQRMLANDPDEAAHQAELFLKENSLAAYYDEVAIWGLALAQLDAERGELNRERCGQIKEAVDGLIDNLADDGWEASAKGGTVLCVAGRSTLDEAVAAMLAQLLDKEGMAARVASCQAVSAPNLFRLDVTGISIVCLSYLEANDLTSARYLVRRLRRRLPSAKIVIGFWMISGEETERRDALEETGADAIVTSLTQAVACIAAPRGAVQASVPAAEPIAADVQAGRA